ncbi:PKD domain-containing protein [Microbacterium album]|uniref:PKD domain-containing protein n=1 Tax=Microbacterium album TaxID=2053191 RepID=A0A917IEA6_9MICO|nr:PKD domain-containing protein [Microbacterium album]GGH41084.1 hypothetical protein GCM10010921_13420 [Microbacterium album]
MDFSGTSQGYIAIYNDVEVMKAHVFLYNNPAQGSPGSQVLRYLVIDWVTEQWIKPSTGEVIGTLVAPSSPIVVPAVADVIYTTPAGRRFRLGKPSKQGGGIDIPITEFAASSGTITAAELVILEQTGPVAWERRPLGIDPGVPFGGVGNAPYFAGFALPDPGHTGKKVAFIGRNFVESGERVHVIDKLTLASSWAQPRTTERIAESSRPLVRPMCPVNAGSIDVLWTEVVKYGNGYPDANGDINFFGIMVAHYRPVDEPVPPMVDAPNIPPVASFTATPNALTVTFTNTSTDSDGTFAASAWGFGDGNSSTDTNPVHTYEEPGHGDRQPRRHGSGGSAGPGYRSGERHVRRSVVGSIDLRDYAHLVAHHPQPPTIRYSCSWATTTQAARRRSPHPSHTVGSCSRTSGPSCPVSGRHRGGSDPCGTSLTRLRGPRRSS